MFEIISVTARRLCREPFEARMEKLAASGASRIILREKDMEPRDYAALAVKCRGICGRYGVRLIAHTYAKELLKLGFKDFHMPLPALESFPELRDSAAVRVWPWEAKARALRPSSSTSRSSLWGPERHCRAASSAWWCCRWCWYQVRLPQPRL